MFCNRHILSRLARVDNIPLMATRNPARKPADSLSHDLQGFSIIPGGFLAGFLNQETVALNLAKRW